MDLILAIDDDQNVLNIVEAQLVELGYRVIKTTSPSQGISIAMTGSPSLILLDIMMPERDGFHVLKDLMSNSISSLIPVIMLSSKKDRDTVVGAMKMGVADYMVKPCSIKVLKNKIETALKYGKMKRSEKEDDYKGRINIARDANRTVISFMTPLSDRKLLEDVKTIFNKGFLVMTVHTTIVFDLRPLELVTVHDIPLLKTIVSLFAGKPVYVIAGKHFGTLIEEIEPSETLKLFISPGDMEQELQQLQ